MKTTFISNSMRATHRLFLATALIAGLAGCASAPEQADDGGYVENKTTEKTERQKGRVENRVDERVDQETDEAVDSVLDRALENIFN